MNDIADKRTLLGYDIDLTQLARTLMERRSVALVFIFSTIFLALIYLHLATYTYTATLMVSPVMSSSSDSIAGKLGGLSNLASFAGINIAGDMGTQAFMLYQEGIDSRDVADELAKNPDIMHTVFHKKWDAANKQWIRPPDGVLAIIGFAKDTLGIPNSAWQPPDGALLQEYIVNNVDVEVDPQKPIITITYPDEDPQFAVKFLHELDRAVDNKLRGNALVRANQYIDYLSNQLNKVTNSDIRESLMTTLTDQEKMKMMASATAPYAAEPFGLPSASRKPTNPKPFLVLAAAAFTGGLLGILAAVWLPALRWPATRLTKFFEKPKLHTGR